MKKIRERMQQRLRDANTEASLKRQEEQQKAKEQYMKLQMAKNQTPGFVSVNLPKTNP